MRSLLERNVNIEQLFTGITAAGVFQYSKSAALQSNIKIQINGSGGAAYTVRVRGTSSQIAPDLTSSDAPGNEWTYIQLRDNNSGNYITGSTGIVIAADGTIQFDLNTDVLTYFAVEISSYTSGTISGFAVLTNNT